MSTTASFSNDSKTLYETVTSPTSTNGCDSAPGPPLLAVAVHISMSQRITWVAGVLYVMPVLSGTWILYITEVEGPVSRHRWVRAHGASAEAQRQQRGSGGGVHRNVVMISPVRSGLRGGGGVRGRGDTRQLGFRIGLG